MDQTRDQGPRPRVPRGLASLVMSAPTPTSPEHGTARPSDSPAGHRAGHPGHPGHPGGSRARIDYAQRPMLVFWETTRACQVACRHCRASALTAALPGELDTAEGLDLIDQVAGFGRPYPILVLTGGDCLVRPDLFQLV